MIDHIHLLTDQPKPPSDVLRIIKGITPSSHRLPKRKRLHEFT
jgi:hypothetical protein